VGGALRLIGEDGGGEEAGQGGYEYSAIEHSDRQNLPPPHPNPPLQSEPMKYWLMKCEPSAYTIDDLKRDGTTSWEGVRNYQARNFMRDQMQVDDPVLFYASNADPSGVTGVAR